MKLIKVAAALPLAVLVTTAACAADPDTGAGSTRLSGALTSFDNCDQALSELRANAEKYVGETSPFAQSEEMRNSETSITGTGDAAPETEHSETNVAEAGVDEPDLVKTDGERIVAVRGGTLEVVDAADATLTGSAEFDADLSDSFDAGTELLLYRNRALVIAPHEPMTFQPLQGDSREATTPSTSIYLFDIGGDPELVNTYEIEGSYLDGRAIDNMSTLVIRSTPQLEPYTPESGEIDDIEAAQRESIDNSTIDDWLPQYTLDGKTEQVPCRALARPEAYSASSMLTVLSFDLTKELDDGSPVSIEADGQTVYGSSGALYIANDRSAFAGDDWAEPSASETEFYRFGLGGDQPVFESSATVPGYVLNTYSMSEWDGHFRVATTSQPRGVGNAESVDSAVYVLTIGDDSMAMVGSVDGLGAGEWIYAVRFSADIGYVVTYRETDPLYIVDLSTPGAPTVTDELELTGYSAYLHPLAPDRLLGVGQAADADGVTQGTQVSLFDVGGSGAKRLDSYTLPGTYSMAEFDPHAFLYWPDSSLVVFPVGDYSGEMKPEVLLLKVSGDGLVEAGTIDHGDTDSGDQSAIVRSLVIGESLWTMSDTGLTRSGLEDFSRTGWVSF